jgi:hypothetical protein
MPPAQYAGSGCGQSGQDARGKRVPYGMSSLWDTVPGPPWRTVCFEVVPELDLRENDSARCNTDMPSPASNRK